MALVNVLAVLLSPLVAVLVTVWLQNRKEKRDMKRWVFNTLVGTRHGPITDEAVRALNMIDVVFHDSPKVRQYWREYYDMLGNPFLSQPEGFRQRQTKNLEMIGAMAKDLGLEKSITALDVDRVYYPQALGEQARKAQSISDELLRVLRGTQGLVVHPVEENQESAQLPSAPSRVHLSAPSK
jgi:hypothetical protein